MHTRRNALAIVAIAIVTAAGCHTPRRSTPRVVLDEGTLSVSELANRLGLRLDEQNDTFVVLKSQTDSVLIFTHADGRFFVNGRPVGSVGPVKIVAGTPYVSDTLVAQIRPYLGTAQAPIQPTPRPPRGTHVAIDAGHGGHDPGAIGVRGTYEKDINLAVARKVAAELQRRGLTVTMTRSDDRYPELEERADIANRRDVDLFVSIHCDSAPNSGAQGFTLYVAEGASSEALAAARAIAGAMAATGSDSRGINRADYRVLVRTRSPAVLIELGYLSNAQEEARLRSSAYQDRLAAAIAAGIEDYLR
ncbi:MAG: N-acetylmuramoyl-L-alanine amidase [Sedimentisphaerales bacterium]|nr:N-acetylmuramoyl-L-alanine amidase [Sedimentisphaerales bacterium]